MTDAAAKLALEERIVTLLDTAIDYSGGSETDHDRIADGIAAVGLILLRDSRLEPPYASLLERGVI